VAHAVDVETGKLDRARSCPDHGEVLGWLHRLRAPVRVAYEAGPTGFGLARAINEAGMECVVADRLQRCCASGGCWFPKLMSYAHLKCHPNVINDKKWENSLGRSESAAEIISTLGLRWSAVVVGAELSRPEPGVQRGFQACDVWRRQRRCRPGEYAVGTDQGGG
jgi:hypothetical protein